METDGWLVAADVLTRLRPWLYLALSGSLVVTAVRRHDVVSRAFIGSLLANTVTVLLIDAQPVVPGEPLTVAHHVALACLTVFPLLLLEFSHALRRVSPWARVSAALLTAATVAVQLSITTASGVGVVRAPRDRVWELLLVACFLLIGVGAVVRMLQVGHDAGRVVRSRMRLLAGGAAATIAALVFSAAIPAQANGPLVLFVTLLGLAPPVLYVLGYQPPAALKSRWRRESLDQLLEAAESLGDCMPGEAKPFEELLQVAGRLIGASGLTLIDADGVILATAGVVDDRRPHASLPLRGGVLEVIASRRAPWYQADEHRLLRQVTIYLSVALQAAERHRLHEAERAARAEAERARHDAEGVRAELALAASTDPLTGLRNRRSLSEVAGQFLAGARRRGAHVGVIAIDLDNFKMVNDTRGHQTGDECLVAVAAVLRHHTRTSDIVARVGGDEFVVIVDARHPDVLTQRLKVALTVAVRRAARMTEVGASVGFILTTPGVELELEDLLARADAAMYLDKRGGPTPSPAVNAVLEAIRAEERAPEVPADR